MSSNTVVSGPSSISAGGQPAGVGEDAHAGGTRGCDARAAVLDDHAPRRARRHPPRSVEEQIGGGLAVRDFLGAEDPSREPVIQAGQTECVAQVVVGAARRDAGR